MQPTTLTLTKEREVKHSIRYKDDLLTIYIPKDLLGPKPYPKSITITLEPGDAQ